MKKNKPTLQKMVDGYSNVSTGLGIAGVDKAVDTVASWKPLKQVQCETLYGSDAIARKIVDIIPREALREGIEFISPSGEPTKEFNKAVDYVVSELERLDSKRHLAYAWSQARLSGGSLLFISVDDGLELDQQVNMDGVRKVNALHTFDKSYVSVSSEDINTDLSSADYGKPVYYRVSTGDKDSPVFKVHHSRVIRFHGEVLSEPMYKNNGYWHDSVLTKLNKTLKGYGAAIAAVPSLVLESNVPIVKVQGLAQALAEDNAELVIKRLGQLRRQRSSMRLMAIDGEDDFAFPSGSLTGIKDSVELLEARLVGDSGIPKTLLMGTSPSASLGSESGSSEFRDFYDTVKELQDLNLRSPIWYIIQLLFSQISNSIPMPEGFDFKFNALYQQSEKELLETRKLQADIDGIYIDRGVYSGVEAAENRFGKTSYSFETTLDLSEDREGIGFEEAEQVRREVEATSNQDT